MKVLLFVLGPVLGLVLRELGGFAPAWADRLVRRRSRKLTGREKARFVVTAASRLAKVPGDWSKLIFAVLVLRADETKATRVLAAVGRRVDRSPLLLWTPIVLMAALTGMATIYLLWPTGIWKVPLGLIFALVILSAERFLATPIRPVKWWTWLLQVFPRFVAIWLFATVIGTVLTIAAFDHRVGMTASDSGALAYIRALSKLEDSDAVIKVTHYGLVALVFLLGLLPVALSWLTVQYRAKAFELQLRS